MDRKAKVTSITMTVWRRPAYTRQVLDSLTAALAYYEEINGTPFAHRMLISLDGDGGHDDDIVTLCHAWYCSQTAGKLPYPQVSFVHQPTRIGEHQDGNHKFSLDSAFSSNYGSEWNLHLEDDTVLSLDSLLVADQYRNGIVSDQYLYLGLHNGREPIIHPGRLREVPNFHGWGWITSRGWWQEFIGPKWNLKQNDPKGWDWTISWLMHKYQLKGLIPCLSRVHYIGRDGGRYETPEHYDAEGYGTMPYAHPNQATTNFALSLAPCEWGEWTHGD
jgi:hypothetical protein